MLKKIFFVSLAIAFILSIYFLAITLNKINILQKQLIEDTSNKESRITLYESEDKMFYHLLSNDDQLWILFTYDEQGLKNSFGAVDALSGKRFGFNFNEKRELTSFYYDDMQYTVMTNIFLPDHLCIIEELIERVERINDFETNYILYKNGVIEVNNINY